MESYEKSGVVRTGERRCPAERRNDREPGARAKKADRCRSNVLVKEYVDDGYSGSLLDRPGLEALRRDVRTPLFDAVYFLDTDRIARDVAYLDPRLQT
jgi:DNA invertase Pin-like site-specific DNA recombinase